MKHVLGLKLVSGEDIISEVTDSGEAYTLHRPTHIGMINQGDRSGVGLIDLIPASSDKTIAVDKTHVIYVYGPREEVVETYKMLFDDSSAGLPM